MAKPILNENLEKAQTESNLSITSNDINIELNKEFLEELQMNTYHGWIDEDVVDHIAKVLKMVDLIYVPGVDSHQLRMKFFSLSLVDDAKEWWIKKEMLDEGDNWGIDPLEFISRINSSFDRHMKIDGRTKKPPIDYTPLNNPENHIKASSSSLEQSSDLEKVSVFWLDMSTESLLIGQRASVGDTVKTLGRRAQLDLPDGHPARRSNFGHLYVVDLSLIFPWPLESSQSEFDLEACMVDSFALEMLPELVLDAGFFVLV
ncbi:hypothetical protein Tco_0822776 [Tanacetum coccineum]|uniref:Uncharacterized protein n=1 Tax=Tanacetum coccineum TaxID=301880 RepID=A0ABQ5AIM5_9ASTR